jgi:hypothetical protein
LCDFWFNDCTFSFGYNHYHKAAQVHSKYDLLKQSFKIQIFIFFKDIQCIVKQLIANFVLYLAVNFAGMYTKYLTDRGQRLAFIETHKAMEHKRESENEYQKTQRLLDSSKLRKQY